MNKPTLVLGATVKNDRYAYLATMKLLSKGHDVVLVGKRHAMLEDHAILAAWPTLEPGDIHTVTMYMRASNQKPYHDRLLALRPQRVIFNPGTENPELETLLSGSGILFERSCTLVLLSTGSY